MPAPVPLLIDATVLASVLAGLLLAPEVLRAAPGSPAPAGPVAPPRRRPPGTGAALAVVIALLTLNQVLVTVYVLREHGGDTSFITRHLPAGWFALADGNAPVRWLAAHWPAPRLLAPSVLRVPALLELPFVLLAFATVLRMLDPGLYRRAARSPLLPLAAVSYTVAFCAVEWQLHNPYTVDDILLRVLSAALTPLLIRRLAARDDAPAPPAGAAGLLLFGVGLWAVGRLVLALYDTVLLYNLGRLGAELPAAAGAVAVLAAVHRVRVALPARGAPAGPAVSAIGTLLRRGLVLFLVPALAVRYGTAFGTPVVALAGGLLVLLTAALPALRAGAPGRLALAGAAGLAAARPAARWVPDAYYEAGLLRAATAFLLAAVAAGALADRLQADRAPADRLLDGPGAARRPRAAPHADPVRTPDGHSSPDRKRADSRP
ncbi:hypothetical protein GCM10010495_17470 [Kitasatospora herbaricolor]|uniref:hypothetical protein n=1 Tax=Kitasatospora herbaricolor TaxID=68217 RepID=UPI0017498758|nr:hypothetical protein [Kitasatospora herbaricolor]MDQ0308199.1 hypothetical protein [Kitasatospora herbaricolor]GGV05961.1 hypothetical protein GCM10010495_17470 [Kitasatospora herbaricolor]